MQQINTMAKSGEKRQLKKKRGFRLREEQMFVALYRASVANWKTKNKTHPDIGCSKTLIQKKRQFILGLIKCLFRRVTEDESCKSSVKTKQKEWEEWQLVLPIKKKKESIILLSKRDTKNHFNLRTDMVVVIFWNCKLKW